MQQVSNMSSCSKSSTPDHKTGTTKCEEAMSASTVVQKKWEELAREARRPRDASAVQEVRRLRGLLNGLAARILTPPPLKRTAADAEIEARGLRLLRTKHKSTNPCDVVTTHPTTSAAVICGGWNASGSLPILAALNVRAVVNCQDLTSDNMFEGRPVAEYERRDGTRVWTLEDDGPPARADVVQRGAAFSIDYHRLHIYDLMNGPRLLAVDALTAYFRFVEEKLRRGESVLVHCAAGMHRAGSATVAWVMYACHLRYRQAVLFAQARRPCIAPPLVKLLEGTLETHLEEETPDFFDPVWQCSAPGRVSNVGAEVPLQQVCTALRERGLDDHAWMVAADDEGGDHRDKFRSAVLQAVKARHVRGAQAAPSLRPMIVFTTRDLADVDSALSRAETALRALLPPGCAWTKGCSLAFLHAMNTLAAGGAEAAGIRGVRPLLPALRDSFCRAVLEWELFQAEQRRLQAEMGTSMRREYFQ